MVFSPGFAVEGEESTREGPVRRVCSNFQAKSMFFSELPTPALISAFDTCKLGFSTPEVLNCIKAQM